MVKIPIETLEVSEEEFTMYMRDITEKLPWHSCKLYFLIMYYSGQDFDEALRKYCIPV